MDFVLTIILGMVFLLPSTAFCKVSKEEVPQIIKNGLEAYKKNGPEAAVAEWIKGSPYEGSKDALSQANIFKQIESFYGKYVGYRPIGITTLTSATKIYYIEMDFDHGPVYTKLMMYKGKNGWHLSGKFYFNTEPEKILPKSFFKLDN